MSAGKNWWNSPIVKWLSFPAAVAMGPLAIASEAVGTYLLIYMYAVPGIIVAGGRCRYVVWQLAAVSMAVSAFMYSFGLEGYQAAYAKESVEFATFCWIFSSIVSAPVLIVLFADRRAKTKQLQAQRPAS